MSFGRVALFAASIYWQCLSFAVAEPVTFIVSPDTHFVSCGGKKLKPTVAPSTVPPWLACACCLSPDHLMAFKSSEWGNLVVLSGNVPGRGFLAQHPRTVQMPPHIALLPRYYIPSTQGVWCHTHVLAACYDRNTATCPPVLSRPAGCGKEYPWHCRCVCVAAVHRRVAACCYDGVKLPN